MYEEWKTFARLKYRIGSERKSLFDSWRRNAERCYVRQSRYFYIAPGILNLAYYPVRSRGGNVSLKVSPASRKRSPFFRSSFFRSAGLEFHGNSNFPWNCWQRSSRQRIPSEKFLRREFSATSRRTTASIVRSSFNLLSVSQPSSLARLFSHRTINIWTLVSILWEYIARNILKPRWQCCETGLSWLQAWNKSAIVYYKMYIIYNIYYL